ncbi:protein kinase [Aspergillus coremiiformis]|uniref:non-specific serine/threonine protein kinase n=1 Tax=Aspergillus coremiiformis TaxID=138285 RepID=A0A5N6Z1E9_9EURO|nr:protein kinase [Aspergillus coremiiformis]
MMLVRLSRQLFARRVFWRSPSLARQFSQSHIILDSIDKLEEETLPWYSHENFFPVKIGDVFRSRYQVVGKLGYGGYSTVWLCRDLQKHIYVTLKMYERNSTHAKRETQIYNHIESLGSSHTGALLVRTLLESFHLNSPDGSHSCQCLVHPPLAMSLFELRNRTKGKVFPEDLLKQTLIHILLALDFLHTEAHVIHTDIQEKNIMLSVEDESILRDFEKSETLNPSPWKMAGDRIIYRSRKLGIPKVHGRPVLADFGEARFGSGSGTYCEDVQPLIYRAPEVVLRMAWDEKIDIWNLGVLAWDLFEAGHLFYARDSDKNDSDSQHLAEMIALLGPPPREILDNSEYARSFFDSDGNWKGLCEIPSTSLEKLEGNLQGVQQGQFLCFMRKMLRWRPEERASAEELLSDAWLRSP